MNKKNLRKFSLISIIIGVLVLTLDYLFFHFVTDSGISLEWHPEAGKPFVTELIGNLGVLFIFSSAISLISSFVFFKKDDK